MKRKVESRKSLSCEKYSLRDTRPSCGTLLCKNFHEGDATHEHAHGPGIISALLPRTAFHCPDPGSPRPFASFSASTPCSGTKGEPVRFLSQPKNGRGDPV